MQNTTIKSAHSSTELKAGLESLNCSVIHYNNTIHIDGDAGQIAAGIAFVTSFDVAGGVMKDVITKFNKLVQAHLDAEAVLAGYDDMMSACSYAGFPNAFQTEAQTFLVWRAEVWIYIEAQYEEVKLGNRTIPAIADVVSELPTRVV